MRLLGALSEGGGTHNEDLFGFSGTPDDVTAAWVFDGVTGINGRNYLPAASDARWLVEAAHGALAILADLDLAPEALLKNLVDHLIESFGATSRGLALPEDYDPPAACLTLAKRYTSGWVVTHLGDSAFLASYGAEQPLKKAVPHKEHDDWLWQHAEKSRIDGVFDIPTLLQEFKAELQSGRSKRNQPGGYSILEADARAAQFATYFDIGWPKQLVLCTDGYYRAVDHYHHYKDASLLTALSAPGAVEDVLRAIRATEKGDPACKIFPRFKPSDDASVVSLMRG